MYRVTKRDGALVDFNLSKISAAMTKAFDACKRQYTPDIIDFLALKVTADFEPKIKDEKISVESIQDSVESVLIKAGYDDVAKAYILYRKQREKIRNLSSTVLDYKDVVKNVTTSQEISTQKKLKVSKFISMDHISSTPLKEKSGTTLINLRSSMISSTCL